MDEFFHRRGNRDSWKVRSIKEFDPYDRGTEGGELKGKLDGAGNRFLTMEANEGLGGIFPTVGNEQVSSGDIL